MIKLILIANIYLSFILLCYHAEIIYAFNLLGWIVAFAGKKSYDELKQQFRSRCVSYDAEQRFKEILHGDI